MTKKAKLLAAIRNNPKDVRLTDLVGVLESVGFAKVRQNGSHAIYQHPKHLELVNLQSTKDGKAKPYQVAQVLAVLERCQLEP